MSKTGAADAGTITRMQLDHLREAAHRLQVSVRPDEKSFMLLLNNQITKLENSYAKFINLAVFQIEGQTLGRPGLFKATTAATNAKPRNAQNRAKRSRSGSFAGRLEQHLDSGQQQVRVPLDRQLAPEKRLTFDLYFKMDMHGG
ncbi:hypothetical protein A0256_08910 [Mucilaginibacter sp. PAMC 26640]|nr:hypothetical protein A0256_08910 [Mucilaginibacter sp. PAMC 26640]